MQASYRADHGAGNGRTPVAGMVLDGWIELLGREGKVLSRGLNAANRTLTSGKCCGRCRPFADIRTGFLHRISYPD
jgi:hypothetical protein